MFVISHSQPILSSIQPYLIIILLVIIFYIRTLNYSIIVDDVQQYMRIKKGLFEYKKGGGVTLLQYFKQSKNKINALKNIIFKEVYQRFYGAGSLGLNTIKDHAFTTALHAVTCCLMYAALGSNLISFIATLLYIVNPVNDQTAVWLNGRRYQIAIICVLIALIFAPWGFVFYLFSISWHVTGMFSAVLFYDYSPLFLLAPPIIIAFSWKKFQAKMKPRMERIFNNDQKAWTPKRLIVVVKSYGWYFFKCIFPGLSMMNYPKMIKWGVTKEGNKDAYAFNVDFLLGIAALLWTGIIVSIPDLRLYGLFIFLGTLQWCAIICAFQQLTDRYISLVNIFMMYCLSYIIFMLAGQYAQVILGCFFVGYAIYLHFSMRMYRCMDDFFEYQSFYQPSLTRNSIIHCDTYLTKQDVTSAWMIVRKALRYDPNDFELLFRAAQCSFHVGLLDKADEFIQKAQSNYYVGQKDFQASKLMRLKMEMAKVIQKHNEKISKMGNAKRN